MDAYRRTSTLRRVATTASLAALVLIPAGQADAAKKKKPKSPVITAVSPMKATVGQTLVIRGRNFRKGKGRNSVGFKRDGAAVVFVKSSLSTERTMSVELSTKLEKVLYGGTPARFRLRVLAARFGKSFTSDRLSPTIAPRPIDPATGLPHPSATPDGSPTGTSATPPAFDPAGPEGDCDGDTVKNKDEQGDIDNDLLSDALENKIGTDGCKADSDGDGVSDAYEYKSAVDLNDDEYQQPNTVLPYPGKRPYPNPLNGDAALDYDGDVLTLSDEYALWAKQGGRAKDETYASFAAKHLSYSDGMQYSASEYCPSAANPSPCGPGDANRRVPTLRAAGYAKQADFLGWAGSAGYATVMLKDPSKPGPWWAHAQRSPFDLRDVDLGRSVSPGCDEQIYYDYDCDGYLSDDERDEDADGLTNYDEAHGRMRSSYWTSCYAAEKPYVVQYAGTDLADTDTDDDGIRDGADDQDHDDYPNMVELSRMAASHLDDTDDGVDGTVTGGGRECKPDKDLKPDQPRHPDAYGKVQPFDPCDPDPNSRTCPLHPEFGQPSDPNWWSLQ